MELKRIVMAGGPGTGKTTVIKVLKEDGYFCFDEVSRQVTLKAQEEGITQLFLDNPLLFSQKLLKGREKQYLKASKLPHELYFYDRGIPEVLAYMDYKEETIPEDFYKVQQACHYDVLFYFPIWEDIYASDNERYESFEEAKAIDPFIRKTYEKLGYRLIEVPKGSSQKRKEFILNSI